MAKLIEELVVIKLSRMVKDSEINSASVTTDEHKALLEATLPALIEEVINDPTIIVELSELG